MAEAPESGRGQLSVTWSDADHLDPVFADNMHMVLVNDQYYVTFGQLRLPIVPENSGIGKIHPIARLIVPRDALQRIVEVLTRNLERTP